MFKANRLALQTEVGMRAGVDEREDQNIVFDLIQKHPVIFYVAVSEADKIADKRMVFILGRQCLAFGQHLDNSHDLLDVFAALEHLFKTLLVARRQSNSVLHDSMNSSSLLRSVQVGALGLLATSSASFNAARRRACLLIFPSLKGISPAARHFLRKQVMPVVMFMPISSKNSSASVLRSASRRIDRVVVIIFTCKCLTMSHIVAQSSDGIKMAA